MKTKTAVITGASSGIGMEFARAFARMGYSLILTARRKDRLEKLASELSVPCEIVVSDLSNELECYQLWEKISHRDINVFINNAGFEPADIKVKHLSLNYFQKSNKIV